MKKTKKVVNIAVSILTALLLLMTLIVLIIGINANRQNKIPKIFGYTYSTVSTGSMVPMIEVGDIIITNDVDFEKIEVLDVIVFYSESEQKYIVHRVEAINEDGSLVTKGIANPTIDDEFVFSENYVGRVKWIIPKIGKTVLNARNFLFLIIILIFIFIIISEIRNIIRNINNDRREKLEKEFNEKYNVNTSNNVEDNNKEEKGI